MNTGTHLDRRFGRGAWRERTRTVRTLVGTDPETWTYEELYARARAIRLPGASHMTRRQLIDELRPGRMLERDAAATRSRPGGPASIR